MIGEKKIEQLIKEHCEKNGLGEDQQASLLEFARRNMRWAITLFKMELWHSPTEEPKPKSLILCERKTTYCHYMLDKNREKKQWDRMVYNFDIVRWCYLSDILPKEGGEQWESPNL